MLVNVPRLVTYYTKTSEPSVPGQRVAFGTSGHRSSAFEESFNERHILAICLNRERKKIDGPLFPGVDTHAFTAKFGRKLYEVPARFKWFVDDYSTACLVLPERRALARLSFVCMAVSGRRTKMASSLLCLRRRLRRPSGTEDIYRIYAESFQGADHRCRILEEAQMMVNDAFTVTPDRSKS